MTTRRAHPIPMISGDEYDAFTSFRRYRKWRARVRKAIKKVYNRRLRRELGRPPA